MVVAVRGTLLGENCGWTSLLKIGDNRLGNRIGQGVTTRVTSFSLTDVDDLPSPVNVVQPQAYHFATA